MNSKIFDDRITIDSPGRLYGNLTVDVLNSDTYQSELRNKLIAEAFYLTGIIEKYGSGLTRIRRAVAEAANVAFSMQELPNGFFVTFLKMKQIQKAIDGGINGGINGVLSCVKVHPGIKGIEIAATLNVSQRTLERLLKQLKDEDKIVFKGARKTGGYYVVGSSDAGMK